MSEIPEKPAEIVPAKSEDKLEIEKEEKEEKVEDDNSETKEGDKKEEKDESGGKGESSSAEKGEKDVEDTEKKDPEKSDEKEKKFSLPKIKTPKIIKEIRSRSKSREKKKKKEKDGEDNEEAPEKESDEDKKEQKTEDEDKKDEKIDNEDAKDEKDEKVEKDEKDENQDSEEKEKTEDSKEKEAEGKSEDNSEKKDVVKDAKSKVKDALDSIHLPKMPKMHKPAFLKKKTKDDGEKVKDDEEAKDNNAGEAKEEKQISEESNEKTEKSEQKGESVEKENEKKGEEKEDENDGEKNEKTEDDEKEKKEDNDKSEEGVEERKPSIIDSLKNIKAPKMPKIFSKTKKGETDLESGKCDESEQLLEEKDQPDGEEKDEGESEPKEKQKGKSILKSIRNVASGVPALFKKDSPKETDVESGEKDDLLQEKEDTTDNKPDDLKMEEIKLEEDEKKDDLDNKSQCSEKKDPEKGGDDGEVMEEKSKMDRFKRLPSDVVRQVSSLDKQKMYGIIGILVGLLLLILVIIIAAVAPRGWKNYHKLVEGGKYVEAETGCGKVWGWVEGDDRFLFRAIPYSVDVERFSHSRLPANLDECGDELKHPLNESRLCMRRTAGGVVGEEDCLTLDIATSSVVYDNPAPVVVYIAGDNDKLMPSAELAHKQGAVFVTISVRQGILGYLSHSAVSESEIPPTSGNYALGDLITALKWVQLNIRHFGGNPDMVTLLGHQQGASLITALTAVEEGHGLYNRIWATGGVGNIGSNSLDEANTQFNDLVESVCKDSDRDCLVELDAEDLVSKVKEDAESWSHDNLPTRGEGSMMRWITTDTKLLSSSLSDLWSSVPVSVPIVFGAAAQSEANSVNYQLYDWNNTDQVDSIVESSLGSFDVSLSAGALELYNNSNNWLEYISMVSDIRTVCPLRQLASEFKNFSTGEVSFYIAQQANPSEDDESGNVADSSTDISAIFGLFEDQRFGESLQRKFFQFVNGHIDKLSADVTIFDKEIVLDKDERCSFWTKTSEQIVPKFAKGF